MPLSGPRTAAFASCLVMVLASSVDAARAQSPDQNIEHSKSAPPTVETAKREKKARADQAVQAGHALKGPAANPECVWLGQRVVNLLWRDDLVTAFRHLDLYDRFGCPGGHVRDSFRCVVRQGNIDSKANETLNSRVHSCWLDPQFVASEPVPTPTAQTTPQKDTR